MGLKNHRWVTYEFIFWILFRSVIYVVWRKQFNLDVKKPWLSISKLRIPTKSKPLDDPRESKVHGR